MNNDHFIKPNFLIIGAQKAGTTWLWDMLKQHPGTALPKKKEIHFFGSAELFARGIDWYYHHFYDLDENKVIGEASTTYFYDRIPYWFNESNKIEYDESLPPLPELITQELPNIKIIISLRDPVGRAVSAYKHYMKNRNISPKLGLTKVAKNYPKLRILEYGFYEKYIEIWKKYVPPERLLILIFEEDIRNGYEDALVKLYHFLGLSTEFKPRRPNKAMHKSWTWSRILFYYYTKKYSERLATSKIATLIDRFDPFEGYGIKNRDIEFLRSVYLPRKEKLENILGRDLSSMKYGLPH
jgi:hypothetical protein